MALHTDNFPYAWFNDVIAAEKSPLDQAIFNLGNAQSLLVYLSADLAKDNPTFNDMGLGHKRALLEGAITLINVGINGLLPDGKLGAL